ncbi:MAG: anti-anti-sigma factor [Acidobacteria bacterium]|jgi:anti-anti-sigma factor|nr:MAG: anti-anti-sigma factor [Acidobacteriota bacterium]
MLVVNIQNAGDAVILKCTGRVVAGEEVANLKSTALCHQESKVLVLDFSKVEIVDGAGLGLLAFLAGWSRVVGTQLTIVNPVRRVREVLELTNLDSVLEIRSPESLEEAFGGAAAARKVRTSPALVAPHAVHCQA